MCAFTGAHRDRFGVVPICRALAGQGIAIAPRTCGEVIIVRFADDFVAGFQYQDDAGAFQSALREPAAASTERDIAGHLCRLGSARVGLGSRASAAAPG